MIAKRELAPNPSSLGVGDNAWRQFIPGDLADTADAPITIIAFSDYQCPACRQIDGQLRRLLAVRPARIRVIRRHLPLPAHPFAAAAAHASECGRVQGRFDPFDSLLYEHQDSIGHWAWNDFARMAGVMDLKSFDVCMTHDTVVDARIARDTILAHRASFRGTPTVFINSIRLDDAPSDAQLERLLTLADPDTRK